jgi:hypothetical protein
MTPNGKNQQGFLYTPMRNAPHPRPTGECSRINRAKCGSAASDNGGVGSIEYSRPARSAAWRHSKAAHSAIAAGYVSNHGRPRGWRASRRCRRFRRAIDMVSSNDSATALGKAVAREMKRDVEMRISGRLLHSLHMVLISTGIIRPTFRLIGRRSTWRRHRTSAEARICQVMGWWAGAICPCVQGA